MNSHDNIKSAWMVIQSAENLLRMEINCPGSHEQQDQIGAAVELLKLAVTTLGKERGPTTTEDTYLDVGIDVF